jgi:hypothetical protein
MKSGNLDDWSLLYPKPESLLSSLMQRKESTKNDFSFFSSNSSYLSCPAFNSKLKNTYVFSNSLKTSYSYNFENGNNTMEPNIKTGLGYIPRHHPTIKDGPVIEFALGYLMFADKPLNTFFSSPYFHKSKYTQYGSIIPGEFDIGQWFRPYLFEVQMWNNKGEFILEEEPIFYASFMTNDTINMKRFNMTEEILRYSISGSNSTLVFGKGQSLVSRYNRFKAAGQRERILTEINKNLINDDL